MINQKIQLTDDGRNLFPNPNLVGIDVNNVIGDITLNGSSSYTALVDCYITAQPSNLMSYFRIDDVDIIRSAETQKTFIVCLKKGQTIKTKGNGSNPNIYIKIFGLKYI